MAETKPIPVRLGEEMIARLNAAAKQIGNKRAGVIRFLVLSWLDHFEKNGVASLPPNWKEIMASMDHRTKGSRQGMLEIPHHGNKVVKASSSSLAEAASVGQGIVGHVVSSQKRGAAKSSPPEKTPRKARAARPASKPPVEP